MFKQIELRFLPGLFSNRSARSSRNRWVDGDLVRFRDGLPEQIGGWVSGPLVGDPLTGKCRDIIAWRPNNQLGRYIGLGTHTGYFMMIGASVDDITPAGFTAGREDTLIGAGYGAGPYGAGAYGTRRATGGTLLDASVWTTDMFGEILLACFNTDGKIYDFDLTGGDTQLQLVAGITGRAICVSDERHLFVFGADGEPGLVKWSDREDYTNFTVDATTRAGSFDMQATSPFQCGRRVRGFVLGWTATEVFGFYPLNNALVYGRERLSTKAGAAGPQSVAVVTDNLGETAYWIGQDNFYLFDGYVRELECELRDYVFGDINLVQRAKFVAETNALFSEIWFFYCSANSDEIDRAVIYNYSQRTWMKASLARTAWLDAGIFDVPIGIAPDLTLYEHESGEDADGTPMESFVVSHPVTLGVGQQFAEIDQFWPDMKEGSADCTITFITRDYPGGPDIIYGPYEFAVTDDKVDLSLACRQFQLKIASDNGYWEMGTPLLSVQGGSLR